MNVDTLLPMLEVPPCPGGIDALTLAGDRLIAAGWMFQPGHALDAVAAHVDGAPAGDVTLVARPDVDAAFAWAAPDRPAAFTFEAVVGSAPARLDVIGFRAQTPVARLSSYIGSAADEQVPLPPEVLQERVSGHVGAAFRAQGLRMFTDLTDQMLRRRIPAPQRLLDWGCGCGRVTRHVTTRLPDTHVTGCDIDGDAVEWCRGNLSGEFAAIVPMPPTAFAADRFDAIIACSVLTHLSAPVQETWLAEMRRVLAPGGHFLVSTQGAYAFELAERGRLGAKARPLWRRLVGSHEAPRRLAGVEDAALDPALDGIAPPGYYRGVFQSRAFTVELCARYFEVVDYVERGLNGHQDLVVLRRPA